MEVIAAKEEYTNRLVDIMTPFLYKGLYKIWVNVRKKSEPTHVFIPFQRELANIPKWNQDMIDEQYKELIKPLNEQQLDKLIEAVFVSNVHILSSIRNKSQIKKFDINIPETKVFMHRCYVNCARVLYTVPYLLDDRKNISAEKRQQHYFEAIEKIQESVHKTIRENLPINDIIEFTNNSDNDVADSDVESNGGSSVESVKGSEPEERMESDTLSEKNFEEPSREPFDEDENDPFMHNPQNERAQQNQNFAEPMEAGHFEIPKPNLSEYPTQDPQNYGESSAQPEQMTLRLDPGVSTNPPANQLEKPRERPAFFD